MDCKPIKFNKTKYIVARFFSYFCVILILQSCKENPLPKPASFLRLDYPNANYKLLNKGYPFSFEYSNQAKIIKKKGRNWLDIKYPNLKATVVMTYRPIKDNLRLLLIDAEKLTFNHTKKADDIDILPFYENLEKKVYVKSWAVYGNAASQIQFQATDSVKHFITGALYFYAKPNYDSILPAIDYLKKDIVHLIETLEWKN